MNEKVSEKEAIEEKSKGKYTELELRTRGIGKFFTPDTHEWAVKASTYHDEEVKRAVENCTTVTENL